MNADAPTTVSSTPPSARPLSPFVAWPLAALVYGALMTAAALWGLKVGERGLDSRSVDLLACYAIGSPLGLMALAPLHRFLMPRRPVLRYAAAFVLVAGASVATISLVAFLWTNSLADAVHADLPLIWRVRSVVEPYALEIFLFLTLGQRIAMPQALVPLALAAWWLGRRRGRIGQRG